MYETQRHTNPSFLTRFASGLAGLGLMLSSGCFVAVGDSDFGEDGDSDHFGNSKASRCADYRSSCLIRAGADTKFQATCHDSYRSCMGYPDSDESDDPEESDESTSSAPSGDSSSGETSPEEKDPVWQARCNAIEAACAASSTQGPQSCRDWGRACRATDCGEDQLCSTHAPDSRLENCWTNYRGCAQGSNETGTEGPCTEAFRGCVEKIPSFGCVADGDAYELVACLDLGSICERFAGGQELARSCSTILSFCLEGIEE